MTGAGRARRAQRGRGGGGGEQGSTTVWFVGVSVVFLVMLGLVVDVGRAVTTKMQAVTVAGQAARRAVDLIDPEALRQDRAIPATAAQEGACAWVATAMPEAGCSADLLPGGEVAVTVTAGSRTSLLAAVGVASLEVSARQSAQSQVGAAAPQEGQPWPG